MAKSRRQREEKRKRVSARRRAEERSAGFTSTTFTIPDGVKMFRVKEECIKRFDILSYRVGKGNPYADPGELHFERTYHTHPRIGANEDAHICLAKTYNKPCPVCEHRVKLEKNPNSDQALVKSLRPKERQLWLLKDQDDPDSLYLWDMSYHLFGKILDQRIKTADEDEEFEYFADLDDGLTLKVAFEEVIIGQGKPFYSTASIDFKPRRENYGEAYADELPCLDDLLIERSYEELESIFYQVDGGNASDEEEEVEKPAKSSKRRKPEPEPEEEPEDEEDELEEEDEDEPPFDADDEEEEEEEEKPEPPKKSSKPPASKKKPKPEPEPEPEADEDDASDDEEEWDEDW